MKSCSNSRGIKMMCHEDMGKSSSSEVKRKGDEQQAAPWCRSEKKHYKCDVYCESVDGEV